MEHNLILKRLALVSMVMASAASAQAKDVTPEDVKGGGGESLNRFGISYRMGLNISARFKNIGGYTSPNNPGPATGVANHFYDDGYNLEDMSHNAGDVTTYWGYENASQHVGDTIVMSSTSASANGVSKDRSDDPQHGVELTYNRELGPVGKMKWGVEGAVNYTDLTIRDNGTIFGNALKTSDAYPLNGVVPPLAPYHATFQQLSGPAIGSIPSRTITTIPNGAVTTGKRNFEADIYGLRVGPYLQLPLSDRFSVAVSGGLSLLQVESDFRYQETVTIAGVPHTSKGSGSHSDLLVGGYFGGNLLFDLTKKLNLSLGAQFQSAGTYTHKENGKEAQLDLGQSVFVSAGVGFKF